MPNLKTFKIVGMEREKKIFLLAVGDTGLQCEKQKCFWSIWEQSKAKKGKTESGGLCTLFFLRSTHKEEMNEEKNRTKTGHP